MSWLQISEKTAYSKFTKDKSTLKNVYHSSITRQRTKLFILLLACFFSLLTSVVFNCEDISRWNEQDSQKNTKTHTHTKKNWNRIDYSALAILCSLFLAGFFFVRIWSEKSLVLQHVDCIYLPKKIFHFMQDYLGWSPTQEFQTRKHLVI